MEEALDLSFDRLLMMMMMMMMMYVRELNDLYSSPNIVRVIKSRRMRWAGHVARMGGRGEAYERFW